ncbi:MAG: hypothetical protein IKF14_13350 [Atopobiaceae bacterium]|nr:hypothetical protein [Atopobiaceae bacterium]MBR3160067.1 hypothetical protein [Atopobiaceae bacterium]
MVVQVVRIANCGTYTRVNRWTSTAKPTNKHWEGRDKGGVRIKKRIYRCERKRNSRNMADLVVKLDRLHNIGRDNEYMPLDEFVSMFAL